MDAPIKPRYAYVDDQLRALEDGIIESIRVEDQNFWEEVGDLSTEDVARMNNAMYQAFRPLMQAYESSKEVTAILENSLILIQNCAWCAMNLPCLDDPDSYIYCVAHNVRAVFNRVIFSRLRTEMIMANHHCEVIQRNWRRCVTDPEHAACKRRLEFDCAEFSRDLMSLKSNSV